MQRQQGRLDRVGIQIDAASKSAIDRRSYPSVDVRALHRAFVLNPMMEMPERAAVGITLVLAGVRTSRVLGAAMIGAGAWFLAS